MATSSSTSGTAAGPKCRTGWGNAQPVLGAHHDDRDRGIAMLLDALAPERAEGAELLGRLPREGNDIGRRGRHKYLLN